MNYYRMLKFPVDAEGDQGMDFHSRCKEEDRRGLGARRPHDKPKTLSYKMQLTSYNNHGKEIDKSILILFRVGSEMLSTCYHLTLRKKEM